MKQTLDCKAVARLLSDGQDLTLAPPERARLRLHFVFCASCREVDAQVRFLREAMRRMRGDEPPPG